MSKGTLARFTPGWILEGGPAPQQSMKTMWNRTTSSGASRKLIPVIIIATRSIV